MSRENSYSAIVIKKQAYGEADEIVTLYTRQAGKLRVLCKSSKLPASRLGPALQTFFSVNVRLTKSSALPKVIGVEVKNVFPYLQAHTSDLPMAFVAAEIIMRATPDEQTNESLFDLLASYLDFLNSQTFEADGRRLGLLKFKIDALEALGLGISYPQNFTGSGLIFSNSRGGFSVDSAVGSGMRNLQNLFDQFLHLKQSHFPNLPKSVIGLRDLDSLVSDFLSYQLEREIKSEKFIKEVDSVV